MVSLCRSIKRFRETLSVVGPPPYEKREDFIGEPDTSASRANEMAVAFVGERVAVEKHIADWAESRERLDIVEPTPSRRHWDGLQPIIEHRGLLTSFEPISMARGASFDGTAADGR